ncbi:MAG: NTP transferase domain-containing protein [Acidobacteria bacterium]|nr:NTP transferase domain-containing protein [Acidobacteriota bacterium]
MSRGRGEIAAMVLAAGRGRRMRPLSDVLPKPALPILGRPVVAWALDLARRAGARRIAVNVWHLAGAMEAVARTAAGSSVIGISREPELLGGAGGLAEARDRGLLDGDGPVLMVNGDGLVDLDLGPLFERHRTAGDLVTLALLPHPDPGRWSRIHLDETGRVSAMLPPGARHQDDPPWLYPGVMLLARELVEAIPSGPGEIADRIWTPARRAGRLGGTAVRGTWREVGTPAGYRAAVHDALGGSGWRHPSSRISPAATLTRSMAGEGVVIGPHTVVRDCVFSHGATIGTGCRIEDCIILGPLVVPDGTVVRGAILAERLGAITRDGPETSK